MSAVFYRMDMVAAEEGLITLTKRYISIRETEHLHFCLEDYFYDRADNLKLIVPKETIMDSAKRHKYKIYRIFKSGSRIASSTEEGAFQDLLYRKRKQLTHLKRNLAVVGKFLELVEGKELADFPTENYPGIIQRTIPDTVDFVLEHFYFN